MIGTDVIVIGGGAAGLMAAIAARGALERDGAYRSPAPDAPRVQILEGSPRIGLKILVSGGGRCNVCNVAAGAEDFVTDRPAMLRGLLQEFSARHSVRFFESLGLELAEEPIGKLFPASQRASDVLDSLLEAVRTSGAELQHPSRVVGLDKAADGNGWFVDLEAGIRRSATAVILATGGKSLPKTGSTGFGYDVARRLGIEVNPPLPALTPVCLSESSVLQGLAGLTLPMILSVVPAGTPDDQVSGMRFTPLARAAGSVLITHRGVSGPAALDISGTVERGGAEGRAISLRADYWSLTLPGSDYVRYRGLRKAPGSCMPPGQGARPISFAAFLEDLRGFDQEARLLHAVATRVPRALAGALLHGASLADSQLLSNLSESQARRLYSRLVHSDLEVTGTEGFPKAEVTCGGVPLAALERTTLESRRHQGLFFCGEVVDVTGRLGGFNFQWAWTSGAVAGRGARSRITRSTSAHGGS